MNKFLPIFLLFFALLLKQNCPAQNYIDKMWQVLSTVEYKETYDADIGIDIPMPVFSKQIKAYEGKIITIKGYVLPMEEFRASGYVIFSAFPFENCFFCGGAGPESVLEVHSKKKIPYSPNPITIRGKLTLNSTDFEHLMYILKDCEIVLNP